MTFCPGWPCHRSLVCLATIAILGTWTTSTAQPAGRFAGDPLIGQVNQTESNGPPATVSPWQAAADQGIDWCQTQIRWEAKAQPRGYSAAGSQCPTQGSCDIPATRDAWIPDGGEEPVTIRLKFNIFANDDGSNPAATEADATAQVAQLDADYLPSRIRFTATTEFIHDSQYRVFTDSEEYAMKSTYVDDPAGQLNIYVTSVSAGWIGFGTFPWDPQATATLGGVVLDAGYFGAGQHVLSHEIGHCLGLWHTHHGVTEVTECGVCYERADGADADETGDFASDTAPTPVNFICGPPGGTDPCCGVPWGDTDPQNYMSYAPDWCWTEFSQQQWGRMHCWIEAVLAGWFGEPRGACCHGANCAIETESSCLGTGGVYLGDSTVCDAVAGNPVFHQATVNLPIPDGGGPGDPVTHTINVPDSFVVGDVNLGLQITHSWVGDLVASVSHGGTTVTVVDQPGVPTTQFGCSADNYDIVLDDEGTGGAIEAACQENLSSPPNYFPNELLGAFDGMDAAGDWTVTLYDNYAADPGTLNLWSLEIDEMGPNPCQSECSSDPDCDDGVFCNGAETCNPQGQCVAGTDPCGEPAAPYCDEDGDACRECMTPQHCDDDNECTSDDCAAFVCVSDPLPNGSPCAGGLGSCDTGVCIGQPCDSPADCDDGDWCSIDECIDNECLNWPRVYGDTDLNQTVNVFDIFCILDGIGGDYSTCSFENDDIDPCGGDGTLNLFDAFAALDAIAGIDPCCGG